ncbi:MAG: DNA replication protein [Pseudomonadota bacterium]
MIQLALDLGHRAALGREDFLIAQPNMVAVALIDRWPAWPGAGVALFGPAGCGKSHLAQVWRAASKAREVDPAKLEAMPLPELMGEHKAFLLDGLGVALDDNPARQEAMLHLYNMARERGAHLMVTDRRPPSHWHVGLPDLASRLSTLQAIEMGPPDDALLGAVLVKLFADRQLTVKGKVISYLLARMERSFAAARRLVAACDKKALEGKQKVTTAVARQALEDEEQGTGG